MPTDAVMTINERRKYLTLMQQRYLIATRQGRQPLLDEMELITGLRRRQRRPPGSIQAVAREIPMRRIAWDTLEPGHFEVDLIYHGGGSASGDFMYTLQLVNNGARRSTT